MNFSTGYLPSYFTIPAVILTLIGYLFAVLYKLMNIEILSMGLTYPWLACFLGILVLGRTKEKLDDERVIQIRNFSYRYLSEFFIWGIATLCILGFFFDSWGTAEGFPGLLLTILLVHLYYLKIAVLFDGIDEQSGKLRFKYQFFFVPYFIIVMILNIVLFI